MLDFLAPRSKEQLITLVREYLEGKIFFSTQVRDPSLIPQVFMPVLFGAFGFPEKAPVAPPKPVAPPDPQLKEADPHIREHAFLLETALKIKEEELTAARKVLADVQHEVDWSRKTLDSLTDPRSQVLRALAAWRLARARLARHRTQEAARFTREAEETAATHREALRVHKEAVAEWEREIANLAEACAAYEARGEAWRKELAENLGVLYAYHSTAMPRSINGYPMFTSVGVLNRGDWERVLAAIKREEARERAIDV